jgi:hypothetical protein
MLATTIGKNMMQFSQAIIPVAGAGGAMEGETALATGKGYDQDQIAKLKDACGVSNAQQIPPPLVRHQYNERKKFRHIPRLHCYIPLPTLYQRGCSAPVGGKERQNFVCPLKM